MNGGESDMRQSDGSGFNGKVVKISMTTASLALLVAVLAVFGFQVQKPANTAASPESHAKAKAVEENMPLAQVMIPQRRDVVRELTLSASISPWQQASLYSKVPGYLKWIGYDKGDRVEKGEVLAVIEAPEVEQRFKEAEARHAIQHLTATRLEGVWKKNHDVIAKQVVDVARAEADKAEHVRNKHKAVFDFTKIRAPFSGTVTARFVHPGAMIQAAEGSSTQAAPLLTIMDMSKVRIYVKVPQEAASYVGKGLAAHIKLPALPDRMFHGTVTRTTEALDPTTRTLLAEIDMDNTDGLLHPGMYANITLDLETHSASLVVPPEAVVQEKTGGEFVYIVEEGKARKQPVVTGIDDGAWVEVAEGLTGTEKIVVVGKGGLSEGHPVKASSYSLPDGNPASQAM